MPNWEWITPPTQSFAGLPVSTQLTELEADIAIVGLHYQSPYPQKFPAGSAQGERAAAPGAIRRQSSIFAGHLHHFDFDFNDTLLADQEIRIVDCGDIDKRLGGGEQKPEHITAAMRTLLDRGALPIAMGTD